MKYNAKRLEDDEYPQVKFYAVFAGKKYFTDTVTTSKKDAERSAITMSMRYHYNVLLIYNIMYTHTFES